MVCAKTDLCNFGGFCGEMYVRADVKHEIHFKWPYEKKKNDDNNWSPMKGWPQITQIILPIYCFMAQIISFSLHIL